MERKKKSSFKETLFSLIMLVPGIASFVINLGRLIKFESQLAIGSITTLGMLGILAVPLLTGMWFSILIFLFFYFVSLQWSPLLSLFIIFILNMILLIILGLAAVKLKRNLFFPATCRQLLKGGKE